MTRDEAAALIDSYTAPEGALPVGSVVAYEDASNPYRRATVIGYRTTRWGTDAILERERWTHDDPESFDTVNARTLATAGPRGRAGWSIVLDLR